MFAARPKTFTAEKKEYLGLDEMADKVGQMKCELDSLGRSLRRDRKLHAKGSSGNLREREERLAIGNNALRRFMQAWMLSPKGEADRSVWCWNQTRHAMLSVEL